MANKKRLIDYNEMRELFDQQYKETVQLIRDGETHLDNLAEGFFEADRVIWKLPAVDAVEVVRCGECKHYENHKLKIFENCVRDGRCIPMSPNDFCSYGERKDD